MISIDGIDKANIEQIDLDKLKDAVVTIEKQENKKLTKVQFNNLTTKDQNYLLEKIKKQNIVN